MSKIDFSQLVDAETRKAKQAAQRAADIKAACAARIGAVMDVATSLNLQGAAIAGELDGAQMDVMRAGLAWVRDMQQACRSAIAENGEPVWPEVPEGLTALAQSF
ncbi:hypothetical protein [uncultured Lentibacter sp.]|uniref:hypothetical protein n=1 Tax=uncultured Lentibacter sp. TaxID=1659309 RepID=UPI00262F0CE4|nr:hypothetical protein [uncultured Lentibacter sp.]